MFVKHTSMLGVLALVLSVAAPLQADSDGYYCVGPNYIAYQFGLSGVHHLTVVRLDSAAGIRTAGSLELPQFQVHGAQCGRGWIDLAGFDAVYHVTLDLDYRPTAYSVQPFPAGQVPSEFVSSQPNNLGAMAGGRAYTDALHRYVGQADDGSTFFLDVTATVVSPTKTCELNVRSRIVRLASDGTELDGMTIFEGIGYRECGE